MDTPSPPAPRPSPAGYRLAWWVLGATALALLVLQGIGWLQGRRAPLVMLNPAGLLCLSCGSLLHRQPLRGLLITVGVLLMLLAIAVRYWL